MRGVTALAAACLTAMLLPVSSASAADEPFWNSRPLGYWLNQLRVGDSAARQMAARGVGEIATEHGSASVAAAVPLLVPCLDASDVVSEPPALPVWPKMSFSPGRNVTTVGAARLFDKSPFKDSM